MCQDHSGNMGQFCFVMNLEPGSMGAGLKSMSSGASVVLSLTGGPGLRDLPWCWGGLKPSFAVVGSVWTLYGSLALQHLPEASVLGA